MFYLLGPTAAGKTEIAVEAALRCNAEIIGADAFQVYQGLDLLTAKPGSDVRARVPHHLIGEVPLGEKFDVGRYREMALERVKEIESRGKRPLIVGGTGLYIRALTHGLAELPPANPEVRRELEALTLAALQEKYGALDPRGMERIDRQNRRRLIRGIEVSLLAGAPFSSLRADWSGAAGAVTATGVILERDRADLFERIDERIRRMFAAGVIEEVRFGGEAGPTAAQAIGYREIRAHLHGTMSVGECIEAIRKRTRQYAKRQLTWLRAENSFSTINLTNRPKSEVVDLIARRMLESIPGAGPGEKGPVELKPGNSKPRDV